MFFSAFLSWKFTTIEFVLSACKKDSGFDLCVCFDFSFFLLLCALNYLLNKFKVNIFLVERNLLLVLVKNFIFCWICAVEFFSNLLACRAQKYTAFLLCAMLQIEYLPFRFQFFSIFLASARFADNKRTLSEIYKELNFQILSMAVLSCESLVGN